MKASEWLRTVDAACEKYFPEKPRRQEVLRATRVKVRIEIDPMMFADLFFREETGRIDYALIVSGRRRYGLDNPGGWHEHPLHDSASRFPSIRHHLMKRSESCPQQHARSANSSLTLLRRRSCPRAGYGI